MTEKSKDTQNVHLEFETDEPEDGSRIDLDVVMVDRKRFQILQQIGKDGHFAKVFCAAFFQTNEEEAIHVAVKVPHFNARKVAQQNKKIRHEFELLRRCNCPAVVQSVFIEKVQQNGFLMDALVTLYIPGLKLTLAVNLLKAAGQSFERSEIEVFIKQLISAVAHLHEKKIMHRDLNPKNIIVGKMGHLTLVDLQSAVEVKDGKPLTECCGEAPYISPEMTANKGYSFPADVYSLGAVCFYMVTLKRPQYNREQLVEHFSVPDGETKSLELLIELMLSQDPKNRPTSEALRMEDAIARGNCLGNMGEIQPFYNTINHGHEERLKRKLVLGNRRVDLGSLIGEGGYGRVHIAYEESRKIAAKLIKISELTDVLDEFVVQNRLNHDGIVKMFAKEEFNMLDGTYWCYFMELFPGASLTVLFKALLLADKWFEASEIKLIIAQMADILLYLKTMKVVHRDIKDDNLLINERGLLKLIDFSFSKEFESATQEVNGAFGAPGYCAPEIYLEARGSTKSDVFSAGVVVFWLLFKKRPFTSDPKGYRKEMKKEDSAYPVPHASMKQVVDLMTKMLKKKTNERLDSDELVSHPYFKHLDWASIRTQKIQRFARRVKIFEQFYTI